MEGVHNDKEILLIKSRGEGKDWCLVSKLL